MQKNEPKQATDFPPGLLDYVKERYHYSLKTGLVWIRFQKESKMAHTFVWKNGRIGIAVIYMGKRYRFKLHRLGWFLVFGEFPELTIDHINGNRCDNRLENLRLLTSNDNTKAFIKLSKEKRMEELSKTLFKALG